MVYVSLCESLIIKIFLGGRVSFFLRKGLAVKEFN